MRRREFIAGLGSAAAWPLVAQAQQIPVVGFFSSRSPEDSAHLVAAFRRGLADQGFVEGQNVKIEYLWARGQWDRLPAMAADLVNQKVAVIVAAGGEPAAFAAKGATATIPIVFGTGGDPVAHGIVPSLSRPGGNLTGTMLMTTDLEQKRLGLLHQLLPRAELLAVLCNPKFPTANATLSEIETAARKIGQRLAIFRASEEPELEVALNAIVAEHPSAVLVTADPFFDTQRSRILPFFAQWRLPAVYQFREYAVAGGLMSYGPSVTDNYKQFGIYVGRILKGEKPGDLPISRSTKFDFVINLKTAAELGLDIPPALLALADEVIE
jgi:putative tryptophan/tyrosine transport system substrate-binding protein